MTDKDPELEWAKSVARLFRGLYEDDVFNNAVVSIEGLPASTNVPMPNTAHPAIAGSADFVRDFNRNEIALPKIRRAYTIEPDEMYPTSTLAENKILLIRRKACGLAPFVGDPIWEMGGYFWDVWVDELGRHISGDAKLKIVQRTVPLHRILGD
jgi:hypothetical protein